MLVVDSDPRKKLRCPITGTLFVNPVRKWECSSFFIVASSAITAMKRGPFCGI